MSEVAFHPVGLCQLQIQRHIGGAESSYSGDAQAKDFTATCLVL